MSTFEEIKADLLANQTHHHYVLAHVLLPELCFADPCRFFAHMESQHRQAFLGGVWANLLTGCGLEGQPPFRLSDIGIELARLGGHPAVLVRMPTPRFPSEAYMACIVLKVSQLDQPSPNVKPEVRYFTLEKSMGEKGEDRTVLGEWAGENHLNYGYGPEPQAEAFMRAVSALLAP